MSEYVLSALGIFRTLLRCVSIFYRLRSFHQISSSFIAISTLFISSGCMQTLFHIWAYWSIFSTRPQVTEFTMAETLTALTGTMAALSLSGIGGLVGSTY
ncbi:hypothetical protein OESDEN_09678 [Oesophagostomum dentatum]|uniref:Uncharacterized protein n=1 Tax=Oesophagostomum dentatum TaxID=61180 RepID=A0A0B1T503_OESDE|nr:hypothetical protein OESDEN_09678 [Oesophagostomum dentatum]